MQKYDYLNVE